METLTERARLTYWWPTSGHPVWDDPTLTGREGRVRWTYCFPYTRTKGMVLRKYRLMRRLGAPPIAARWAVDTECQRLYNCIAIAGERIGPGDDDVIPAGLPMAFFPPEPCAICGELGHDEYDSTIHPTQADYDEED